MHNACWRSFPQVVPFERVVLGALIRYIIQLNRTQQTKTHTHANTLTHTLTIYAYIPVYALMCDVDVGLKYVFGPARRCDGAAAATATLRPPRRRCRLPGSIWQNEWICEKVLDRHECLCVCVSKGVCANKDGFTI